MDEFKEPTQDPREGTSPLNEAELSALVASKSFAEFLEPTEYYSENVTIWQLKDLYGILVRESKRSTEKSVDEQVASMAQGQLLFTDLHNKYGIDAVAAIPLKGKNRDGHEVLFTFVEKIDGQNLNDIEGLPIEALGQVETLYQQLANYYEDAWNGQLKYWVDCNNTQIVFGHRIGTLDKHFTVVDIDAEFYLPRQNVLFPLSWPILQICKGLVTVESKFQAKVDLLAVRARYMAMVDVMLVQEPYFKTLLDARKILVGGVQ